MKMDTPSLETKYRCAVKRDGVYGKTQYRGPNGTLYTLAVHPRPTTGHHTSPRRLDDDKKVTLTTNEGISRNHRYRYPDSMGLIMHKEENYVNK